VLILIDEKVNEKILKNIFGIFEMVKVLKVKIHDILSMIIFENIKLI